MKKITRRQRRTAAIWIAAILILIPTWLSVRTFTSHGPATLYFSSPYTQVMPGQEFTVDLRVDSGNHVINAISTDLKMDPKSIQIIGMTTAKSFCTLYTENTFSGTLGTVNIACGTPHPGFQGDSVIVSLRLRAKVAGSATITVDRSTAHVLADDGKGSDLLGDIGTYPISIKQGSY